jgi:hypothetical protein
MIAKTNLNRLILNNRFLIMNIKYFSNMRNEKIMNEKKNEKVRVRFAPSPTGKLHIGLLFIIKI